MPTFRSLLRACAALVVAAVAGTSSAQTADLFISEYIEGSSNNKAIEIYNGTGAAVDLGAGGYKLLQYNNGSSTPNQTFNLTGVIANGDVFVAANSSANATILAQADFTNGNLNFNGDDAIVLVKGAGNTVVDAFGQVGFDPGTEWGTGLASTSDNTLVRKVAICAGDTNGSNAFDPASEWDGFAVDTFGTLGSHTANCATASFSCALTPALSQSLATGATANILYTLTENPGSLPVAGVVVTLTVTSGPNAGQTDSDTTDANGQVALSYVGAGGAGTDNVSVSAATAPNATVCSTSVIWTNPVTNVAIVLNEVDADTPGTDVLEFVELYDGGLGATSLDGLVLVFYNGSNDLSYAAFDLDGKSTNANGYFVLGDAAITATLAPANSLTMAGDLLQNGADAVALYTGSASDFPNGTAVTATNLRDAFVYDTADVDDAGLLPLLNAGQPQVDENGGGSGQTQSSQRIPNGSGGLRNSLTFAPSAPTPMAANAYVNTVTSPAATPSAVCAGQSSTLSGTVGGDETIVWYEGSCGGTVVGEGLSLVVTPTSTTTYYAAAKNVAVGCVSAVCATVTVDVSAPPTWYADTDGDGVGDASDTLAACTQPPGYVATSGDGCPTDGAKTAPGTCGCGVADSDSDGDGTPDCNDGCPSDPLKTAPGTCGCGVADSDTDGDGTLDCNDGCPSDPLKTAPGTCGCGVADTDTDGDGTPDCNDGCPNDPLKTAPGTCGCGVADTFIDYYPDLDGDGFGANGSTPISQCADLPAPPNASTNQDDCDDSNASINPDGVEICGNGIDEDCSGVADDGFRAATDVYVDDDFAALNNGDDPPGPGLAIGCDAFASLQAGIDAVAVGGTVHVAAGTYAENVTIPVSCSIEGPYVGVCGRDSLDRGAEATIVPAANAPIGGIVLYVTADDVTIDGLRIDGDNPAISGGEVVGGVDVNAAHAIGNGTFDDVAKPTVDIDGLVVRNSILVNFNDIAVLLYNSGATGAVSSFNAFGCNRVDNVRGDNSLGFERIGVLLYNDTYAAIDGNTLTRVSIGVQTGNNWQAPEDGGVASISNNLVTFDSVGIWHNLHYANAGTWTIRDNDLTSVGAKLADLPYGLYVSSIQGDVAVDIADNDVANAWAGIRLWNNPTSSTVAINGGLLSGNFYGIVVTNNDPTYGDGDATSVLIDGATITTLQPDVYGVYIDGSAGVNEVFAEVTDIAATGFVGGVQVFGSLASAYVHDCRQLSQNFVGVGVDAGRARVETSTLTGNELAGGYVATGGLADFGDCDDGDVTGLGSSIGENLLTGYSGVTEFAIFNQNASNEPNVLALNNDYGYPVPVSDIESVLWDSADDDALSDVIASQSGDFDGDGTPNCDDGCPNDPLKTAPGTCGCGVSDADTDGDGAADCVDGCPNDPAKTSPGTCGCGVSDVDTDGDGTADCNDGCPNDPAKVSAGTCGCGVSDADSDGDGAADCVDGCPSDPAKTSPGTCGCGVSDADTDGDGAADCVDGCPSDPAKTSPGACGCGVADTDTDNDGTPDCNDGCPFDASKVAPGTCGCGVPDTDSDGDGTADCNDGCPADPNKVAPGACGCGSPDIDADGDGTLDCADGCPNDPNKSAPGICGCGTPDTDSDFDTVPDCIDQCDGFPDQDDCNNNGVPDGCDIFIYATSVDINGDLIPDECQCLPDIDENGVVDGADLALLLGDWDNAGIGDINWDGVTDGADLGLLLGAWGPCPVF
ncbi:MAG: lamin tail domain-containing protein [Phycisphaerae bacterium]|nr:lamin tail domain-containing protein [Phycisphaerae bacterium]